jgi:hypothetical protein
MRTPGLAMTVAVLASSHALFAADTELEQITSLDAESGVVAME